MSWAWQNAPWSVLRVLWLGRKDPCCELARLPKDVFEFVVRRYLLGHPATLSNPGALSYLTAVIILLYYARCSRRVEAKAPLWAHSELESLWTAMELAPSEPLSMQPLLRSFGWTVESASSHDPHELFVALRACAPAQ
jgi:hypothetical protein